MKPSHRYYTFSRGARFRSGERELILVKNDLFRLELFQGRPCVIKDGVVYGVNKRLVSELNSRSEVASVSQVAKAKLEFLNLYGLDIEKAIVKNTQSLITKLAGKNVRHAFKNNSVWLAFDTVFSELPHSVTVEVYVGSSSLKVAAYAPERTTIDGWSATPLLELTRKRLAKYLIEKYGIHVDKARTSWATYGNIHVAGKPFSGKALSYSANWSL